MNRSSSWLMMAVLAAGVAAYAAVILTNPAWAPEFVRERLGTVPVAVYVHIAGGSIALAAGALQTNARVRGRFLHVHRWLGRLYVSAVIPSGAAGLVLATVSMVGPVAHVGFGLLAVFWLVTTAKVYGRIRAGDVPAHRQRMIRSYALTLAAVTLRIYLPISQMSGVPFDAAYQAIAWLCWIPNLIAAEWLALSRPAYVHPL